MSDKPKMPIVEMTPEQVEQFNAAFGRIAEAARAAAQTIGRAYAAGLPDIRERLAKIDASDFEQRA